MFCEKCGTFLESDHMFCLNCGHPRPKIIVDNTYRMNDKFLSSLEPENKKQNVFFIDPNEVEIATYGSGYSMNFLADGSLRTLIAILTDKRIYFRGRITEIRLGKIESHSVRKTIDLKDVTGTGFRFGSNKIWKILLAILTLPTIIGTILFIVSYLRGKKTCFVIEYAGGSIEFELSFSSPTNATEFERKIRQAKNAVTGY